MRALELTPNFPSSIPGRIIFQVMKSPSGFPEYTSVCPKTGLPDYGTITIRYQPNKSCLELKALKMYLLAYRNLGIFYENAVNRMLRDINAAISPVWCEVTGEFTPRGGLTTTVAARWPAAQAASPTARGDRLPASPQP